MSVGALCGLFVADDMARSGIEMFGSAMFFAAMMLSGIAGFYLGLDVPASSRRARRGAAAKAALAELLSATGTFLTAAAALVSVTIVVLDELLPVFWLLLVEASWLLGVANHRSWRVLGQYASRRHRRAWPGGQYFQVTFMTNGEALEYPSYSTISPSHADPPALSGTLHTRQPR